MTITTRSRRQTELRATNVPENVGPGSYNVHRQHLRTANYVPFSTTAERDLNKNGIMGAFTPGPGAYGNETAARISSAPMSVFSSKADRLAPTAPGSSIFRPSTIQSNPGPGSYAIPDKKLKTKKPSAPQAKQDYVQYKVPPTVPTIPRKHQSYGYLQTDAGNLKRQGNPLSIYSGLDQDTVGPAFYNPKVGLGNDRVTPVVFGKSKGERELWNEKVMPKEIMSPNRPGPGYYATSNKPTSSKGSQRPSSIFVSKVPILHEPHRPKQSPALGPGCYNSARPTINSRSASKVQQFGSVTGRKPIIAHEDIPFSWPSSMHTPGPGTYQAIGMAPQSGRRQLSLRDEAVGFHSTTARPCLSASQMKSTTPGPGCYHSCSSDSKPSKKKANAAVRSFGSTTRVLFSNSNDPDAEHPGPGAYEMTAGGEGAGIFRKPSNSSAFKSGLDRFGEPKEKVVRPETEIEEVGNDLGQVSVRETKQKSMPTVNVAFGSNGRRIDHSLFGVSKDKLEHPGPSTFQYSSFKRVAGKTRSLRSRATIGSEGRFGPAHKSHDNGPGSYCLNDQFSTKTFNVTMKPK